MIRGGAVVFLALGALLTSGPVWAHGEEKHAPAAAPAPAASEAALPAAAFPVDIGGPFALTDHTGREVTERDFQGRHLLVFFGYAQCESICPVGLKRMVEALDLLGEAGATVQPVLITVDPEQDTVEALARHVPTIHPRLVGLTGTPDQLAGARKAYKVESKRVGKSWNGAPIFNHGSYIYLMDPAGDFATLLPPVLDSAAMAKIIRNYL